MAVGGCAEYEGLWSPIEGNKVGRERGGGAPRYDGAVGEEEEGATCEKVGTHADS